MSAQAAVRPLVNEWPEEATGLGWGVAVAGWECSGGKARMWVWPHGDFNLMILFLCFN